MTRILWFHPRQLVPPRGGGDHRTLGLIRGALAAGHEVLLVQPDDHLGGSQPPSELRTIDLEVRTGVGNTIAKVASRDPLRAPRVTRRSLSVARREIAAFDPHISVVSEVMTWGIARRLLPQRPWIYDSQNVEHELFQGHLDAARTAVDRMTFAVDHRRVSRAERALLKHSAAVVAVSDVDARGLRALEPTKEPVVVPSSMVAPPSPVDPVSAGPVMLFIGSLDFPPNTEAIGALLDEVGPLVLEQNPDARLLVVGRRPTKAMRQAFAARSWVEFLEDAPSVEDAYRRARCVVMPFKSGSGTKLKLYEALAFGLPVVTTPRGILGVDVRVGEDLLVADDARGIAEHAARVLLDDELARRLARSARATFDDRLSWERAAYPPLSALVARLRSDVTRPSES